MNAKPKVLLAAHDAGGAEILSAWCTANIARYRMHVAVAGPALTIFNRDNGSVAFADLSILETWGKDDFLLTGSSLEADLERRAIALARTLGIRSVTFLDHWDLYRERFGDAAHWHRQLPDEIWLGDSYAYDYALRQGFPEGQLRLVRNPYVDAVTRRAKQKADRTAATGVSLLYVCEPISRKLVATFGALCSSYHDELAIMEDFLKALVTHRDGYDRVTIRLHPSEHREKYQECIGRFPADLPISFSTHQKLEDDLLGHSVIVGIESNALVLAVHLGKPVYSCITGRQWPISLPHGEIRRIDDFSQLFNRHNYGGYMKLAIHGGQPVRTRPFPAYTVIGHEEKMAANRVLDSQVLSKYLGCWHPDFYGGPEVQALEKEWAEYFGVKHAMAVNSCTSGLYCAVGAVGLEPGEEVIVSPYTMSASATAALVFNGVPVFADIEERFFCLDPIMVEKSITSRTRAIIVVDIFGLPHDADAVRDIAEKHGLYVIEDCAQAPGAFYKGRPAGTLADIGVYSLNYHKHIHCGEGGIVVTNDDALAQRIQLLRNHAEAVVGDKGVKNIVNMIGFNFRLPEIEAAITRCQLRKLAGLVTARQKNCAFIAERLSQIPAIRPPAIRPGCSHAYYVQPFHFNAEMAGVSRDAFIGAVRAELPQTQLREGEGALLSCGYVKPLYLLPLYQQKTAYGSSGYPFVSAGHSSPVSYAKGICPVAERMHDRELFLHEMMRPGMSTDDLADVVTAFEKVWENRETLTGSN